MNSFLFSVAIIIHPIVCQNKIYANVIIHSWESYFLFEKKVWQFKNILRRIIIGSDRWEGKFNAFPRQPVK